VARAHDEEAHQMTDTPHATVAVASAIQPTITFSMFSPAVPPTSNDAPEPTAKPRLRLVE